MRVSKNGADVFEIDDSPDSVKAAAGKGYVPVIEMSKDGVTYHDVMGTEDSITAAIGKGYKPRPGTNREQYGEGESFLRGAGHGASFGLDDEAGGAVGALMGKGSYREVRDRIRQQNRDAEEQNPKSFFTGELAGGAAMPVGAGGTAKTLVGAALKGAGAGALGGGLSGFGNSDSEDRVENLADAAKGAAIGTVAGGALGAAGNLAGRSLTKAGREGLGAELKSFQSGLKDDITEFAPGIDQARRIRNGIKETFRAAANDDKVSQLASEFRKHIGPGHSKDMSDRDLIIQLADDGNEQAMKFIAGQASASSGVDEEQIYQLMKAGPKARIEARNFDFDEAGGELLEPMKNLSENLGKGAGERVGRLNEEARGAFRTSKSNPDEVLGKLNNLVKMAQEHKGTVGKADYINAARDIIENGSESLPGLTKKPWNEIEDAEMYDRLKTARTFLGQNMQYADANSDTMAKARTKEAYDSISKLLKFDERQMESDSVWTAYKNLQKSLLSKVEFDGNTDKYKIGGMLKNTDSAKRFRDQLLELDEFIKRPGIPDDLRQEAAKFKVLFQERLDKADLKRAIQGFERDVRGVSGQAVERANSLARGDDLLSERIKAPAQGLLSSEAATRAAEKYYGKPFSQMNADEKLVIIKYMNAIKTKKGETMTFPEAAKLFGGIKEQMKRPER